MRAKERESIYFPLISNLIQKTKESIRIIGLIVHDRRLKSILSDDVRANLSFCSLKEKERKRGATYANYFSIRQSEQPLSPPHTSQ